MRAVSRVLFVFVLIAALVWWFRAPLEDALRQASETGEAISETIANGIRPFRDDPQPGGGGQPTPGPGQQAARPGEPLVVDLVEEPATHYGQPRRSEDDRHYMNLVRQTDGLRYDPTMGHAARELAGFHSQTDRLASGEILSFLLDAAGAAEWTVEQLVTVTTQEGNKPIEDLLTRARESWRRGEPPLRIGVGEAWTLARPARRHLIALVSRGRLEIDRIARQVSPSSTLSVSGRLPPSIPEISMLVMGPDLVVMEAAVTRQGDRFVAMIPMGDDTGQAWIELIGDGPRGPKPMAQLSVHIGEELPWSFETVWPPDESHLRTTADAEAHAFQLFQADRARFGLPVVTRSNALDSVARAHSQDMAQHHFFGHVSPTTGSVTDRLQTAEIRTVFHGENIARNEALSDAEAGLMRSIGHRRNILHARATEVGIGVAQVGRDQQRQWVLTQVVAKPAPTIDAEQTEREVFQAIDAAREEVGRRPFKAARALQRAARLEAQSDDPSPRGVLDRAERSLARGGWAWMATLGELADLQVPEKVLDRRWRKLGVGVFQDPEREGPNIVVVLVVGG